jgi:hypothetical protein
VTQITGFDLSSKPADGGCPYIGLSLHGFRIGVRGVIAQALQHGQAWILGEPGVRGRELAHVESGSAVGVDFTHVQALGTQAYLREVTSFMGHRSCSLRQDSAIEHCRASLDWTALEAGPMPICCPYAGILIEHVSAEKYRGDRQGHERHLLGDVQADGRGQLS